MAQKRGDNDIGMERAGASLTEKAPSEVQRRLLRFFNAARVPEDLLKPPQFSRGTGSAHQHGAHGPHVGHGPSKDPWRNAKLDRDLAIEIIRQRPPFGWREIGMLVKIHEKIFPDFSDRFIKLLGPSTYGAWSTPIALPAGGGDAVQNAALLNTGKVVLLTNSTNTILWDPNTGALQNLPGGTTGLTANLFCSGHSFLSDGRLLVAGGGGGSPGMPSSGEGWKFDPATETWRKTATNMAFRRWYPTLMTLADDPGRVLVAAGWDYAPDDEGYTSAPQMEIYSEATDGFTPVTASGTVGEKTFPQTYPGLHLLPGGEVFYAPAGFGNCLQTPGAYSATEPSGYFVFSASNAGSWTNTGANVRTKGMSVLLLQPTSPHVQILVVGGGTASESATAQLINLSSLTPAWGTPFPLLEQRVHPNAVLLPDGNVFICGGMEATGTPSTGGRCEMYRPAAGTLTEMAEVGYARHYHSFALLLPSGQVMVAGGAAPGGCTLSEGSTIEVFDPPYLFRVRPVIAAAPLQASYGASFDVDTPDANDIAKVVLVRPMAVTHQTDSEQRVVALEFTRPAPNRLSATMPAQRTVAPRGYYMLFIVNNAGVPSVARFILLT